MRCKRAMQYDPERVKAVINGVLAEVSNRRLEHNRERGKDKSVR